MNELREELTEIHKRLNEFELRINQIEEWLKANSVDYPE